jgi:hypothetical protein
MIKMEIPDITEKRVIIIIDKVEYSYRCNDNQHIIQTIKNKYFRHGICMGDILEATQIIGCSIQDVVDIFATIIYDHSKDVLIQMRDREPIVRGFKS